MKNIKIKFIIEEKINKTLYKKNILIYLYHIYINYFSYFKKLTIIKNKFNQYLYNLYYFKP